MWHTRLATNTAVDRATHTGRERERGEEACCRILLPPDLVGLLIYRCSESWGLHVRAGTAVGQGDDLSISSLTSPRGSRRGEAAGARAHMHSPTHPHRSIVVADLAPGSLVPAIPAQEPGRNVCERMGARPGR